jgi:hypothetical protein
VKYDMIYRYLLASDVPMFLVFVII